MAHLRGCASAKNLYIWTMEEGEFERRERDLRLHYWFRFSVVGLTCAFLLLVGVSTVMGRSLVWEGSVYSSGVEVIGPVLTSGTQYVIVAKNTWWYKYIPYNLAADAMYYTTDPLNTINWSNYFPAPGGHSFLQIDNDDVDWGPFSNGDTGHTYTIGRTGNGAPVSFRIRDWNDSSYENNVCHIDVYIYVDVTVGGRIADWGEQVVTYFAVTGLIFACATALPVSKKIRG